VIDDLTPKEIVAELDKYIIGQDKAKRSVAIALRNRARRREVDEDLRDEIIPKNILMIGPTGVGKTEIARRLANLANAPFIKVEATKFTEVGYVGRDVEAIIRDLGDIAYRMVEEEAFAEVEGETQRRAEERLVDILAGVGAEPGDTRPPWAGLIAGGDSAPSPEQMEAEQQRRQQQAEQNERIREFTQRRLEAGELEDEEIEIEVEESSVQSMQIFSSAGMEEMGAEKLIDSAEIAREAVERVEEGGIVFVDELDKVAGRETTHGPDVSREGVQRDILPIIEGCTVMTKYGPINTSHILFIAAGAFHVSKPSDLIPELQGRLPLRVELASLTEDDFKRILVEPQNSLVKQYKAMLATEGIELDFTTEGIAEVAHLSQQVNEATENIGARRLYTLMERLLEELSFEAPGLGEQKVVIDGGYVRDQLKDVVEDQDLSRYML